MKASKANKVRCINGHFFNLDMFSCCPKCGGAVSEQVEDDKKRTQSKMIPPSRVSVEDKTMLLDENQPDVKPPDTGEVGGIKWRFQKSEQEDAGVATGPAVSGTEATAAPVKQIAEEEQGKRELPEEKVQPQKAQESELMRAVAATGHGVFSALPKTVAYYNFSEVEPPTGWLVCIKGVYRGQSFECKAGRNRVGRDPNYNINLTNDASITREPHAFITYEPKQRVFYLQNGTGDGLVYLNESLLFSHEQLRAYDKVQIGNAEFVFVPLCGNSFTWDDYIS